MFTELLHPRGTRCPGPPMEPGIFTGLQGRDLKIAYASQWLYVFIFRDKAETFYPQLVLDGLVCLSPYLPDVKTPLKVTINNPKIRGYQFLCPPLVNNPKTIQQHAKGNNYLRMLSRVKPIKHIITNIDILMYHICLTEQGIQLLVCNILII